jgi:NitT/TauT family transport system substrate-binding protein
MSARRANASRREFVGGLTLAGTASLLGMRPGHVAAEPPPETTTIRIGQAPATCFAPMYVAGEGLLQAEGFKTVEYVKKPAYASLTEGTADFGGWDAASLVRQLDRGLPIVALTGLHVGCYELFARDHIRTIHDLKGRDVAIPDLHSGRHLLLSIMLAQVGLDPAKDVNWVARSPQESMHLFSEGKIDAFLGFPPEPQELRAKRVGRVLVNTSTDRPWSLYFCCFVAARRDFGRQHPVATKRAVRAMLKATQLCSDEPARAARYLVDKAFTQEYEYTRQMLSELSYSRWRDFSPADTLRFYALRLHESGLIKSAPQKILAQGSDWRFLNELKKELKG